MERIAKGIYRIRIGRPEQLTPVYFKETSIMEAEIEQVPISKKAGIQQDDNRQSGGAYQSSDTGDRRYLRIWPAIIQR